MSFVDTQVTPPSTSAGRVIASWSLQSPRVGLQVVEADGCWFTDSDGNRFLDFASQLVNANLGHSCAPVQDEIKRQVDRIATIARPWRTDPVTTLGQRLAAVTPPGLNAAYFTNSGTEANEAAIRVAKAVTGRTKVISRYRSYHGGTAGSLSITGEPRRWLGEPGIPGVVRMLDPYAYRCPAGHPDPCPVCSGAPHLEELIAYEGPDNVAAVIVEPITGINGVIVPPDGYLAGLREVCDRYGILLIFDEVMTGFGRTGTWFAADRWSVVPDILTCGKGLTGGYVPLAAAVFSDALYDWMMTNAFPYGLTYSGHALACAAGSAALAVYEDDGLIARSADNGLLLGEALRGLATKHPSVGDVRGCGSFWGVELVRDRATRAPLVPFNASGADAEPMDRVAAAARALGLNLLTHWNVITICPPLVISPEEIELGIAKLDAALDVADEYTGSHVSRV